ncbi:AGE family epimerase/isomerase [Rhabdaerophilum sp. SD176]|uniref:AGE family epimerase/isomerase n=1 Tax=Rhabdaerophilum sp. SD176 TaxID=2983548 RepID=UPI0024DF9202|nr:AGE family epimerase/isomerase [Rhabdaerophilum sp. SD176]
MTAATGMAQRKAGPGRLPSAASEQLVTWLKRDALPFWFEKGWDAKRGGFHETFFFDGTPDTLVLRSTAVQWQQIYVCTQAWQLGWGDGIRLACRGLERMIEKAWAPDGQPGFVHMLAPNGSVADPQRDTIDHAYAIMALTALARATGDPKLRALLDMVMTFVETALTDAAGDLRDGLPDGDRRHQATTLAILAALLGAVEHLSHPEAALRATRHRRLLERALLDKTTGLLPEAYDHAWRPIRDENDASVVVPAQMAEWTAIIRRYERLYGQPASPLATHFLGAALRAAEPRHGFLIDAINTHQEVVSGTRSLASQSALIRAWLAQAEAGIDRADEAADPMIEALISTYLSGPFRGGWYEKFNASGEVSIDTVPASGLFQVFLVAQDARRYYGA